MGGVRVGPFCMCDFIVLVLGCDYECVCEWVIGDCLDVWLDERCVCDNLIVLELDLYCLYCVLFCVEFDVFEGLCSDFFGEWVGDF